MKIEFCCERLKNCIERPRDGINYPTIEIFKGGVLYYPPEQEGDIIRWRVLPNGSTCPYCGDKIEIMVKERK